MRYKPGFMMFRKTSLYTWYHIPKTANVHSTNHNERQSTTHAATYLHTCMHTWNDILYIYIYTSTRTYTIPTWTPQRHPTGMECMIHLGAFGLIVTRMRCQPLQSTPRMFHTDSWSPAGFWGPNGLYVPKGQKFWVCKASILKW